MPKKDKNGKKPSGKKMKEMRDPKDCAGECQFNVSEDIVENSKVKEKDVFDKPKKKKVPKGSHRMPDGSIMKDSDMPKKNKGTNKKSKY